MTVPAKSNPETLISVEAPHVKNPRHRAFIDNYLQHGNASRAARDAGYSLKTAAVQAAQLIKKPEISAYLLWHRQQSSQATSFSREKLLDELSAITYSNVQDFTALDDDGNLVVDFRKSTREQLRAISGVKTKKRRIYDNKGNLVGEEMQAEFKLWDKLRAAELLGRENGMFKAQDETKLTIDVSDRLLQARSRVMKTLASPAEEGDYRVVEGDSGAE